MDANRFAKIRVFSGQRWLASIIARARLDCGAALHAGIFVCAIFALVPLSASRADTVALWLFDDALGTRWRDDGPTGRFSLAMDGARRVPGKFGGALRPILSEKQAAPSDRGLNFNPTDTRLNLGAHDWTLECWLRLDDAAAGGEGVIFEIANGSAGAERSDELVTRFSVLPRERAFALAHLSPVSAGLGRRIEYANPEGPPGGVAWLQATTLALGETSPPLPTVRWFHVALVYTVATEDLRLFIEGEPRATASARIITLPHSSHASLSLGRSSGSGAPLRGAIDELRMSDHAVYTAKFPPPASLAATRP